MLLKTCIVSAGNPLRIVICLETPQPFREKAARRHHAVKEHDASKTFRLKKLASPVSLAGRRLRRTCKSMSRPRCPPSGFGSLRGPGLRQPKTAGHRLWARNARRCSPSPDELPRGTKPFLFSPVEDRGLLPLRKAHPNRARLKDEAEDIVHVRNVHFQETCLGVAAGPRRGDNPLRAQHVCEAKRRWVRPILASSSTSARPPRALALANVSLLRLGY